MNKRLKAILLYVGGFGLGGGLLYLALRNISFAALWHNLQAADTGLIVLALVASLAAHYARGLRWSMLLGAAGHPVSSLRTSAAVMVGYMVNYAVPRLGEVTRCSLLIKTNRIPLLVSGGTVVTERVVDVLLLGLLLLTVLLGDYERITGYFQLAQNPLDTLPLWAVLLAVGVMLIIGLLLLRLRRRIARIPVLASLWGFVRRLLNGMLSILHLRHPWVFVLLSLLIWVGYWATTYFFVESLPIGRGHGLWFSLVLTTMGGVGMTLPVPGGIGPFHQAIATTFLLYGLGQDTGVMVALVLHTPQLLLNVVVGGLSYVYLLFQQPTAESAGPAAAQAAADQTGQ
ncbi:MAG: lysylphosphatidylglycerol synthase transmembrane domain-containing protein [Sphingobacteriia bacterium]|jgi:uncharacterized protein (TIRG00374 family)